VFPAASTVELTSWWYGLDSAYDKYLGYWIAGSVRPLPIPST
jgi:hypothetical protein